MLPAGISAPESTPRYSERMAKVFGFNEDELKLLLVAVRHIRRTFAAALDRSPDPSLQTFASLYDALSAKLLDMAGPLPENLENMFE